MCLGCGFLFVAVVENLLVEQHSVLVGDRVRRSDRRRGGGVIRHWCCAGSRSRGAARVYRASPADYDLLMRFRQRPDTTVHRSMPSPGRQRPCRERRLHFCDGRRGASTETRGQDRLDGVSDARRKTGSRTIGRTGRGRHTAVLVGVQSSDDGQIVGNMQDTARQGDVLRSVVLLELANLDVELIDRHVLVGYTVAVADCHLVVVSREKLDLGRGLREDRDRLHFLFGNCQRENPKSILRSAKIGQTDGKYVSTAKLPENY